MLIPREVSLGLDGEQHVDFPLGLVLGTKLSSRDLLSGDRVDLVVVHIEVLRNHNKKIHKFK